MPSPAARTDRPNVIVFFTDQQRWDCSSLHGNPLSLMPNFDRIARQGTHVANSFTCAPVCGPARACLQTGTYISRNGAYRNGKGLPSDLPTMAQLFNDAGYRTGYIGKWHLAGPDGHASDDGERGPVKAEARGGYQDWLAVEALEFSIDDYHTVLYDNDNEPKFLPGYRVDAMTDAGIRYIDQHKDHPFFLMLSYIEPHHQNDRDSYPAPTGYREQYQGSWVPPDLAALAGNQPDPDYGGRNPDTHGSVHQQLGGYYGMVKRLDEAFGRMLDALKSLGLDKNTIVLFTSDHACHFKTRNWEYKRSCHDSSIRVPTAITGPGFLGGGHVHQMVSLVDLPATLVDAAGLDVPETMQGRSILPLLRRDSEGWPDEALIQICDAKVGRAIRSGRWKYCVMSDMISDKVKMDFDKVTYHEAFLYDLEHDPYELTNLIRYDSHSKLREVLRQRLTQRMLEIGEAAPTIEEVETVGGGQRIVTEEELYA